MDLQTLYQEYKKAPGHVFNIDSPRREIVFELMEKEFGLLPRRVLAQLFRQGYICRVQITGATDAELKRIRNLGKIGFEALREACPYDPTVRLTTQAAITESDTVRWFKSLTPAVQDAIKRFTLAAIDILSETE